MESQQVERSAATERAPDGTSSNLGLRQELEEIAPLVKMVIGCLPAIPFILAFAFLDFSTWAMWPTPVWLAIITLLGLAIFFWSRCTNWCSRELTKLPIPTGIRCLLIVRTAPSEANAVQSLERNSDSGRSFWSMSPNDRQGLVALLLIGYMTAVSMLPIAFIAFVAPDRDDLPNVVWRRYSFVAAIVSGLLIWLAIAFAIGRRIFRGALDVTHFFRQEPSSPQTRWRTLLGGWQLIIGGIVGLSIAAGAVDFNAPLFRGLDQSGRSGRGRNVIRLLNWCHGHQAYTRTFAFFVGAGSLASLAYQVKKAGIPPQSPPHRPATPSLSMNAVTAAVQETSPEPKVEAVPPQLPPPKIDEERPDAPAVRVAADQTGC